MTELLTHTVRDLTVTTQPLISTGGRHGYVIAEGDDVRYASPYRWHSAEAALQAGIEDAEHYITDQDKPRLGRPPVAEDRQVVDVTLPADLIRRIDYARGTHGQSRAAAIRDALQDTFGEIDLPA